MINRLLQKTLRTKMGKGKAILLIGPRQVGKTTLINKLLRRKQHLFLNGDDFSVRELLEHINTASLKQLIGTNKVLFIDEAQRIKNIGLTLKIIVDQIKNCQVIVSGSSAFELKNYTHEPLTGRKWEYQMYPVSWEEFEQHYGYLEAEQQLESRLIYGMYPDVLNHPGEERDVIKNLTESYLYKDIFALEKLRKPEVLEKILRALAYQLCNEVSFNEMAQLVGVDKNTVQKYIDVLSKAYVIFPLSSFSRSLRNEIKTQQKIYFYDNGIRNAIIGNFNALANRDDVGKLWENFLIAERLKYNAYHNSFAKGYFWRTVSQQEVDYVEEKQGQIKGYEIKWNPKAKVKIPKSFTTTYQTNVHKIDRSNFREFVKH